MPLIADAWGHVVCIGVLRRLQRFLDAELPDADAARIAAHLQTCAHCGKEAEALAMVKSRVAALAAPVDPDAVARLRSVVDGLVADGR